MADFKVPFGSQAGRRPPNADEKINGFPCGPANQQLFNGLFYRLESELGAIITDAGIVQNDDDMTQVLQSIKKIVADKLSSTKLPMLNLNSAPWLAVTARLTTPPAKPKLGEIYLISDNAVGAWEGKSGSLAEWDGTKWIFMQPSNGHGIGLSDGTQLLRVDGKYWQQTAMDVQSGKWSYAQASMAGSNNYVVNLTPAPLGIWEGTRIYVKMPYANTGSITLDVNGTGKKAVVYPNGSEVQDHDFQSNEIVEFTYNGTAWQMGWSKTYYDRLMTSKIRPPTYDFYVVGAAGYDSNTGFDTANGFRTIQGAINAIAARYVSYDRTVAIHISDGTYNEAIVIGRSCIQNWRLIGNESRPENVNISAVSLQDKKVRGLVCGGSNVSITGLTLRGYYECIASSGTASYLDVRNCNLILSAASSTAVGAYSTACVNIASNVTISGSGNACFTAGNGSFIQIGYYDETVTNAAAVKFNEVSVAAGNVVAGSASNIAIQPRATTFSGTVNGRRFISNSNAIITTVGAGKNFIPGTVDGSLDTGGLYF